jgi:hypothetical protein
VTRAKDESPDQRANRLARTREASARYRADPEKGQRHRDAVAAWRKRNSGQSSANKQWESEHREDRREVFRQWHKKNPERYLWQSAKNRAAKKNVPFTIEVEDVFIPEFCPVLGMKLKFNEGYTRSNPDSPSLDRVIPELGYVPGNVQVMSRRANMMKSDASFDELLLFADWVYSKATTLDSQTQGTVR